MDRPIPDMHPDRWKKAFALFDRAKEFPPEERAAFLRNACDGDDALLADVSALMSAADERAGFLDEGAVEFVTPALGDFDDQFEPGKRIGPYRLVRRIGHGGMSVIYLVERDDEQFRRQAALKILHGLGGDREESIYRFQIERQILAYLDHPNIARVYDGGVTDDGWPYLVMEYVPGEAITSFCASRALSPQQRLALFDTVCDAVQHAHQRLVVHRDIKPGNIIVRDDGTVKLLDFGIAKLLAESEAAVDMAIPSTRDGMRLLTPEYAAPEQVRGEVVTTATDVYSLGVLLYELLCGHRPYDLASLTPGEIEMAVCEKDPPRPSTRVKRDGAGPGIPASGAISRRLRGDLDTVVMKALRKAPGDRYQSPQEMAADLRRHREGFPIAARSGSLVYRVRRNLRRHRMAAIVAIAVIAAGAFHNWSVTRERDRALRETQKAEQVSSFLENIFELTDPNAAGGDEVMVREVLDAGVAQIRSELHDQPDVRGDLLMVMGSAHRKLGLYEEAVPLVEEALRVRIENYESPSAPVAESLVLLGRLHRHLGKYDIADSVITAALEMQRVLYGENHLEVAASLNHLATVGTARSEFERAEELYRQALDIRRAQLGEDHLDVAETMHNLAVMYISKREPQNAEPLVRQALAIQRTVLGDQHTHVATSLIALGDLLNSQGKSAEAVPVLEEAVAVFEHLHGDEHPDVANALNALGVAVFRVGRYAEADSILRRTLEMRRSQFGPDHPEVAKTLNDFAVLYRERGDYWSAEPLYRESLSLYRQLLGDDHAAIAILQFNLAAVLYDMEAWDEAETLFRLAHASYVRHFGAETSRTLGALVGLAMVIHGQGKHEEAELMYRDLVVRYGRALPEGHWLLGSVLLGLGRLLSEQDRNEEALQYLEEGHRLYSAGLGGDHLLTAHAKVSLAVCLTSLSRLDESEQLLSDGIKVQEEILASDHPLLVQSMQAVARLHERRGR
jgi:serine/threonine-protein kinase